MIRPKAEKMTAAESRQGYADAADRSHGQCEACGLHRAVQMHHRLHRSHGGDERVENLLHLCLACHNAAHHDSRRYVNGWAVRSGYDPGTVDVLYRGALVSLTADGGIIERKVA